ncbi:MAG TPA: polysaccharide deacetylase family protein [Tepidisphaeraceae bacterium]|jgi:hypothetical protein|nr:polysaccharide deacetylase family protein [Tepidisphaeraceae bacterium]
MPDRVVSAEWTWKWTPATNAVAPQVEVAPFQYGKRWAYALEIDDGPKGTATVVQPLLAEFSYTDAPPGVSGGKSRPFVGGAALIVSSTGTGNSTGLTWDEVRTLRDQGWGIISHSYFHAGRSWGTPPEILTPEQFRNDLFWSQTVFATEVGDGRAPTHFVYPNGYTDYRSHLNEFGLRSGSRVGTKFPQDVYDAKLDPLDLGRTYLDTKPWESNGKGEPMHQFPKDGPKDGSAHIDFTHGIDADKESDAYKRWHTRLSTIANTYGSGGKDDVWVAPTGDIFDYVAARKAAKVDVDAGSVTVTLPDDLPGSRLTLRMTGVPAGATVPADSGAVLYRDGDTAWLTTPMIGLPGAPQPSPNVKRIYTGEIKDLTWDKPVSIAAVRLMQTGPVMENFELQIDAAHEGKSVSIIEDDQRKLSRAWGRWLLFSTVPNRDGVPATSLHVSPNKALKTMEVWAVEE